LVGLEDGDGRTCAHPDDATTIAHAKSKLRDREFLSGAIESNSTMARTSKTVALLETAAPKARQKPRRIMKQHRARLRQTSASSQRS